MKNLIYIMLFVCGTVYSQVGINEVDPKSMLDVASQNKGVLVPRIALQSDVDVSNVVSPSLGEVIFNTNVVPSGSMFGKIVKGFYYWNGQKWCKFNDNTLLPQFLRSYATTGHQLRPNFNYANSSGEWETLSWYDGTYSGSENLTFTAPVKGVYQFILNVNYGLGKAKTSYVGEVIGVGEALFKTQIFINNNVSDYTVPDQEFFISISSMTIYSISYFSSGGWVYQLPTYGTVIRNIELDKGDVCNFRVQVDELQLSKTSLSYYESQAKSWVGASNNSAFDNTLDVRLIARR